MTAGQFFLWAFLGIMAVAFVGGCIYMVYTLGKEYKEINNDADWKRHLDQTIDQELERVKKLRLQGMSEDLWEKLNESDQHRHPCSSEKDTRKS